jgi:hypothetical protein
MLQVRLPAVPGVRGWDNNTEDRMSLSPEAEKVLQEIFAVGVDRGLGIGHRLRFPIPGGAAVFELCELLAQAPREEALQKFLERNPGFLTSLVGTPDNSDLAVIFKPPVGTQYRADFCVLSASQGGAAAYLMEIESSHENLFNKAGTPSQRLAYALKQVEDWKIWINRNPVHYAKELVRHAQTLPLFDPAVPSDRGYRLVEPERVEQLWSAFGGFDEPYYSYTTLIGRWSQMNKDDKTRLIVRNRDSQQNAKTFTYEQLARLGNFRLEREEWSNELDGWERGKKASDEPIE